MLDLLNRINRKITYPKVNNRVFFLHIEKCAGSSLGQAIEKAVLKYDVNNDLRFKINHPATVSCSSDIDVGVWKYREMLLDYFLSDPKYLVGKGHFQMSGRLLEKHREHWLFVTMFREPVARWISYYRYRRYKTKSFEKIEVPLEAFLESEEGKNYGCDYSALLCGERDQVSLLDDSVLDMQYQKACGILKQVPIVGILEQQDRFVKLYAKKTSSVLRMKRINTSPVSDNANTDISEDVVNRIKEVCEPNTRLYNWVRSNLEHWESSF